MKPLNYIVTQKVGTMSELAALPKEEREKLKVMAAEEMKALGIEVTVD